MEDSDAKALSRLKRTAACTYASVTADSFGKQKIYFAVESTLGPTFLDTCNAPPTKLCMNRSVCFALWCLYALICVDPSEKVCFAKLCDFCGSKRYGKNHFARV